MERLTEKWGDHFIARTERVNGKTVGNTMCLDTLGALEDLEEQGRLLVLPCKVGDTIWLVDFEEKAYDEADVCSIEVDTKDNRILINSNYEVGTYAFDNYVFYSKEEAESALENMKGEEHE